MVKICLMKIVICILLLNDKLNGIFIPNRSDYNAYGLKIAMNENLFVEVHNTQNPATFLVQFAPYNSSKTSFQCSISFSDLIDHYVYSVGISESESEFFFAGEVINGDRVTYIGVVKINKTNLMRNPNENGCNSSVYYSIEYVDKSEHEEYYQLGVKPKGHQAYGFSNKFVFLFHSNKSSTLNCWNGNLIWPNESFLPHAVDLMDEFGIIAGFVENGPNALVRYNPIIYLINYNCSNGYPIVVDQYIPVASTGTWQDFLTNSDAKMYSAKYDMSVSINEDGYILVGMQYINRVFFLSVDLLKVNKLIYISRFTNGRSLGYGKSVGWLDNGNMAAILDNSYSFDYDWQSSRIDIYDIQSRIYNSSSIPLSVFPNSHQKLPKRFNSIFLNIVSSSISLALLDNDGNVLIFVPTASGFFPSIEERDTMPLITSEQICLPGTYKKQAGINDCILCPTGRKNPGQFPVECVPCSPSSFCPLGSSGETDLSILERIIWSFPYPKSSEMTSYDVVLLNYMFGMKSGRYCLFVPSLLWTLIALVLSLLMSIIMRGLKRLIKYSTITKLRKKMKNILRRTDFMDEGQLWVGGLLSLSLLPLIICACTFARQFIDLYPQENESVSYFSCDNTPLVNAVFESTIKSLGSPQINKEQKMIDILTEQNFTLNVCFVNTLINCDVVSIQGLFGTTWFTLRWSICININSTLSISIPLPYQHISVRILLSDIKTIGGLRVGLYGDEYKNENDTLKELDFSQSFYKNGYVLGKSIPLFLILTKVINETVSMDGVTSQFSGIFIPTFKSDLNNILISSDQYIYSTLSSISLEISLTESPYYEKNVQQPMARIGQVVFYTILFVIVALDLFRSVFLLYKVMFKRTHRSNFKANLSSKREQQHDIQVPIVPTTQLVRF